MDIKEKITKAMKELQCIPDFASMSYKDCEFIRTWNSRRVEGAKIRCLLRNRESLS